jgi:hypothetical protein
MLSRALLVSVGVTVLSGACSPGPDGSKREEIRVCTEMFADGEIGPEGEVAECRPSPQGEPSTFALLRTACRDGRTYYATPFGWWVAPGGRIHGVDRALELPDSLPEGCEPVDHPLNNPQS